MSYHYSGLAIVLENIAKDSSRENMERQVANLTSDEIRKLKELMMIVEVEEQDRVTT